MARTSIYILCAACFLFMTSLASADDSGYFLSWQQKKDLLNLGRIQDSAGTWYDVWICPGYLPPAQYSMEHLKEAGGDFHEYIEANKYRSLKEGSKECFNWALKTCGLNFTVRGIPRAWGEHFTVAHERTQRRVFGWWMAYPWAFMESAAETAFRGALGSLGTVGGIASGIAVVPTYHALNSAVSGVWNLCVNTVIIPVAGITWNTVIGPPFALAGQKPAESRADGFWVAVVNSDHEPIKRNLSPEEVSLLSQWGLLLLKETQPVAQKQIVFEKNAAEKEAQLHRAMQAMRTEVNRQRIELHNEEIVLIRQLAATNELSSALSNRTPALVYAGDCEVDIRLYLKGQNLSGEDIERILNLLRTYQSSRKANPSPVRKKTDPLRRSVDVISESAEDTLK